MVDQFLPSPLIRIHSPRARLTEILWNSNWERDLLALWRAVKTLAALQEIEQGFARRLILAWDYEPVYRP